MVKSFIRHHFQKRARFIHNVIIIITLLTAIVSHELKLQQCVDLFFFKYAFWSENTYICSLDIALYVYLNISHSLEGREQKHEAKPQYQNVHKIAFHGFVVVVSIGISQKSQLVTRCVVFGKTIRKVNHCCLSLFVLIETI